MPSSVLKILLLTMTARLSIGLYRQLLKRRSVVNSQMASASSRVSDMRKEYSRKGLREDDALVKEGPISLFRRWLDTAIQANVTEPNAMCLSTSYENKPSARIVLLKGYDERGFVWYTNYSSRKGRELNVNPHAAITFWWGPLERSVRIEGVVEKVSEEESDAYFSSRPRGSQIGAWSSNQSSTIASREALDEQERVIKDSFADDSQPVHRPPHWGGYRLKPNRIEFWKGRQSRMHDRLVFERASESVETESAAWSLQRLQP